MTTLLIDVGNSRIKWAWANAGKIGAGHAADHDCTAPNALARRWLAQLRRGARACDAILIVSVASERYNTSLARECRALLGVRPRFLRSERHAGGVSNGYREVWRLGADRWAALIGARALLPRRALCIIDIGTAMTLDLLDAQGRHRGGAIVPGPALMQQSLLRDTQGIRKRATTRASEKTNASGARRRPNLFATDTRSGLDAGARFAVAALVDRARIEARTRLGATPLMLLTGGAAASVAPLVRHPVRLIPDLVLRGLAALAVP